MSWHCSLRGNHFMPTFRTYKEVCTAMLCQLYNFKVLYVVVLLVSILVMNNHTLRNFTIMMLPHSTVQQTALSCGTCIITIGTQAVFFVLKHNKWQIGFTPKLIRSSFEYIVDTLWTHPILSSYSSKAQSRLVKFIHRFRFCIISFGWHLVPPYLIK